MFNYYPCIWPALRRIDPERAHGLAIQAAKYGLLPRPPGVRAASLPTRLWGLAFPDPLGLAAGFDKNAEVADAMLAQGFGFVEVGTITPKPQPGNPQPRVFRLPDSEALINRLGFNNQGLSAAAERLSRRRRLGAHGLVGANVGPNRTAEDPIADCAVGVRALAPLADYVVVNVSSPNTPGLRALQLSENLRNLLERVTRARDEAAAKTPLLVKIAPDMNQEDLEQIAHLAIVHKIDGLIATNTTIERPAGLRGTHCNEQGGLSGRPLFDRSTEVLAELYRLTRGHIPLIGVGGVSSGADAYAKIRAGASLVQLYTAMIYYGPWIVMKILKDLAAALERDGFRSVSDAVGTASEVQSHSQKAK